MGNHRVDRAVLGDGRAQRRNVINEIEPLAGGIAVGGAVQRNHAITALDQRQNEGRKAGGLTLPTVNEQDGAFALPPRPRPQGQRAKSNG